MRPGSAAAIFIYPCSTRAKKSRPSVLNPISSHGWIRVLLAVGAPRFTHRQRNHKKKCQVGNEIPNRARNNLFDCVHIQAAPHIPGRQPSSQKNGHTNTTSPFASAGRIISRTNCARLAIHQQQFRFRRHVMVHIAVLQRMANLFAYGRARRKLAQRWTVRGPCCAMRSANKLDLRQISRCLQCPQS